MTITAALVLYAVLWFLILFIVLPINIKTQGELGQISDGTPASAPENPNIKKKMLVVTIITTVLWSLLYAIISSEIVSITDIDVLGRLRH